VSTYMQLLEFVASALFMAMHDVLQVYQLLRSLKERSHPLNKMIIQKAPKYHDIQDHIFPRALLKPWPL
jgi:hypothetical protein